jgi:hypothetical protein
MACAGARVWGMARGAEVLWCCPTPVCWHTSLHLPPRLTLSQATATNTTHVRMDTRASTAAASCPGIDIALAPDQHKQLGSSSGAAQKVRGEPGYAAPCDPDPS